MKKKETSESKQMLLMLGYLCIATEKDANLIRKVVILDRFSLTDDEVALICDCRAQSVRDARQKIKKKK